MRATAAKAAGLVMADLLVSGRKAEAVQFGLVSAPMLRRRDRIDQSRFRPRPRPRTPLGFALYSPGAALHLADGALGTIMRRRRAIPAFLLGLALWPGAARG